MRLFLVRSIGARHHLPESGPRSHRSGVVVEPRIQIIPSNDTAFRHFVERLSSRHRFTTAGAFAARLRGRVPRVVVRASEVTGQAHVWYVYRDGVWQSSEDPRWWTDPRTPRVNVTLDGWIEEANAPARAILGLPASGSMPRFFTDFAAPGTLEDAADLFSSVAAGHELAATIVLRPASGEMIACDLHAWPEGGRISGAFRLADDISIDSWLRPRASRA